MDVLRDATTRVLQKPIELEANQVIGAARYECAKHAAARPTIRLASLFPMPASMPCARTRSSGLRAGVTEQGDREALRLAVGDCDTSAA